MSHLRSAALIALSATLFCPMQSFTAEPVGQAVSIRTEVSGASGPLAVRDPVYRDERIRTSKSGLGQFVFQDGTKLAVGWGSSVVIDQFVYDGSKSVKKLTIMAAKGTFRWVSGKSKHSAYEIVTPAGTIGVRGTAFDFYVGRDGTTAVVLLSGAASFCGAGGCRQLTQRCDCVVAKPGGAVSQASRVNRRTLQALGNAQALPFLSGGQKLNGAMGWGGGGCGLRVAVQYELESPPARKPDPVVREEPKPDQPRPQKEIRERGHDKHDRNGPKFDRGDKHDRNGEKHDQGGGGNDTGRDTSEQGGGNQSVGGSQDSGGDRGRGNGERNRENQGG
ncbi:FecR domain-containing protein [Ensifer sp. 4252]|uniref:FecR family protein n=1 Tax=Ensifer sp. 4252 TaxID=3373915 RepID=UPI003D192BC1